MQDSSIVLYGGPRSVDYVPDYLTWYDSSSFDNAGLYGEPLSSAQYASYDDSYYLTYEEEEDDYSNQSWCKNKWLNQYYRGKEIPYIGSGTCLGDYTSYFGCYWGENEVCSEEGHGAYGTTLDKDSTYEGDNSARYFNYDDNVQQDENQWLGYGSLDFGGGSMGGDFDDCEYNSSCDNWQAMTLYERIFGH